MPSTCGKSSRHPEDPVCTRPTCRATLAIAALLLPVGGCDTTFLSVSTDGQLQVFVSTSGDDRDTDGFSVSVDGGASRFVDSGNAVTLTDLRPGAHRVQLSGMADNCVVTGDNPRTVVVGNDGGTKVHFDVHCLLSVTGGFLVVVTTAGTLTDPDGYRLAVGGEPIRTIGPRAEETYLGLTPDLHLVQLKDVDPPCVVDGPNPRPVTVTRAQTITVEFKVTCGPVTPP